MTKLSERYSRQELFAPIGKEGQERIRQARVLLAGCGGLGSNCAAILVRAGIGFLRVVDRDVIEISNLQRQSLFDEADARDGVPKAAAAARHLRDVNSDVEVESVVAEIGSDNILQLLDGIDLALDGFDNFESRYILNDACVKLGKPWIYASCLASTVMAKFIFPGRTMCLRCLHRDVPDRASALNCDTVGIVGPAAILGAAIEASIALRFLSSGKVPDEDALICGDVWDLRLENTALSSRMPDCVCCGLGRFEFLGARRKADTTLYGRHAVQVRIHSPGLPGLARLAARLSNLGRVQVSESMLRFQAPPYELTVFADGRAVVNGTTDESLARSLVAQWTGM